MNIKELRKLLDEPKWYHHIPVLGVMIYAMRFELKLVDLPKEVRKAIKFYRNIFNAVSMLIALGILIATLLLRDKHGFGHWPWIFWIGLGFGLLQNVTIFLPKVLYVKGFGRLEKLKERLHANKSNSDDKS